MRCSRAVPYATATVNLVGSAVIGLLAALVATGRLHLSTEARTFVFVGILGGFTTFSSFMLDTLTLGHGGDQALAFWNVTLQTTVGLAPSGPAIASASRLVDAEPNPTNPEPRTPNRNPER